MLVGCESEDSISDLAACSRDDGGLTLPDGFCAMVVGDSLGPTRHLAVADNGDVYAALDGHGIVAPRDTTGDYAADCVEYFGDAPGSGLRLHDGYLSAGAEAKRACADRLEAPCRNERMGSDPVSAAHKCRVTSLFYATLRSSTPHR